MNWRARRRVVLGAGAVVVAVVVAAAGLVVVGQRRELAETRARVERLEREAAAARGAGGGAAPDEPARPGPLAADDPLAALLEALGGLGGRGSSGGLPGLGAAAECAGALGGPGVAGGGLGGLGDLFGGGPGSIGDAGAPSTDVATQVAEIVAAVQEARGLKFSKVPAPTYFTREEMAERARDHVARSYPADEAAADSRVLAALGAVAPGADLRQLQMEAIGGQVAGFYDSRTGELVVARPGQGAGLDGQTRVVLAHELDHALTDQALGLPVSDEGVPDGREDEHLAALSLVEGDATLVMQQYSLKALSFADQIAGLGEALPAQQRLARLPHHVQRGLVSPYLDGLSFVCWLHASGGWPAVDRAYRQPPATTAQVLFPDRYTAGERAADPRDPPALPAPWKDDDRRGLGAAELLWLFEAPGGDTAWAIPDPRRAVEAWGGGEVASWTRGDAAAVGVALVERESGSGLCQAVQAWYEAAFGDDGPAGRADGEAMALDGRRQDAVLRCAGRDVRLGIGPDLATARSLAG